MRDLSVPRQRRRNSPRSRPRLEALERREVLSTVVYPGNYTLEGTQWANPSKITFSFVPDGVQWDNGTTNLNSVFNAKFGSPQVWQYQIAKALQSWAASANINLVQVADSGLPFDTPGNAQGDSRFGDIRIAGYVYPNNDMTTLATTYQPPPNGMTAAGDSGINTNVNFTIGSNSGVDLYSVMVHETGHSLGLGHSPDTSAVMYAVYQGVRNGLGAPDIAGIQALYGARVPDALQSSGQGTNSANAVDLTAQLDSSGQVSLNNVSLATIGDTEYFSVTAPANAGSTLQIGADASGTSLLSPRITVYDASMHPLATAGNAAAYGDNADVQVGSVQPGQHYLIAVTGATNDVFATGSYQLHLAFAAGAPITTQSNGSSTPAPIAGLTADQHFVQVLYNDFLGRSGSISELNSWTAELPSLGQEGVAATIIHSQESLDRIVNQLYETDLGRSVDPAGLAYWSNLLAHGGTEEQVAIGLVSSAEFVSRSAALDPGVDPSLGFISGLDSALLHRQQTAAEVANVLSLLPTLGVAGIATAYVDSAEFHSEATQGFYNSLLHRSASSGELSSWVSSGLDLLTIETLICGTPEFYRNG